MSVDDDELYSFASVELHDRTLYIDFNDNNSATLELKNGEEAELIKTLIESNDFWGKFLGSLSAALGRHQ